MSVFLSRSPTTSCVSQGGSCRHWHDQFGRFQKYAKIIAFEALPKSANVSHLKKHIDGDSKVRQFVLGPLGHLNPQNASKLYNWHCPTGHYKSLPFNHRLTLNILKLENHENWPRHMQTGIYRKHCRMQILKIYLILFEFELMLMFTHARTLHVPQSIITQHDKCHYVITYDYIQLMNVDDISLPSTVTLLNDMHKPLSPTNYTGQTHWTFRRPTQSRRMSASIPCQSLFYGSQYHGICRVWRGGMFFSGWTI